MALSPFYNWSEPDNTSLVKDGAQAMRTLGNAIDTSVWNVGFGQAGKNKIINGNFGVWQRGTSITTTNATAVYTADRFTVYNDFTAGSSSFSQQSFTAGAAPVAGYEGTFFGRMTTATTSTYAEIGQRIEDVRVFAGQTATFSFWAKASVNTTVTPTFRQFFGSGGSGNVNTAGATFAVTTSWQRFSVTFSIPSISGKIIGTGNYGFMYISFVPSTSQTFDSWGWQLEAGSLATPFQTATGTIQGELAACQRYYYLAVSGTTQAIGLTSQYSTTLAIGLVNFPVTMRTAPTLALVTGTSYYQLVQNSAINNYNSFTAQQASNNATRIDITTSGLTAGHSGYFITANASATVAFSSEL